MALLRENPPITDFTPLIEIDPTDDQVGLLTIDEYRGSVRVNALTDDDGYGHPVAKIGDRYCEDQRHDIFPSMKGADIPPGATHINWFNR